MSSNDHDPRIGKVVAGERGTRPLVARPSRGLPGIALFAIAAALGLLLFAALDAKRRVGSAPATSRQAADLPVSAPIPPLYLPTAASAGQSALVAAEYGAPRQLPGDIPAGYPVTLGSARQPRVVYQPQPEPGLTPPVASSAPFPATRPTISDATVSTTPDRGAEKTSAIDPLGPPIDTNRALAGTLANRSTTVPQGTIIPAVLETAFDSTSPGFARAIVQRDIRGFDGTLVLIPRGSHLIGEYGASTSQGQSRAAIAWSRLIRPDGTTIAIASPVTDPVGRNGVKAIVNSHFLERFAGAILQSTLDVGVNLASRSAGSPVIVALPGATQGISSVLRPAEIRPTLRVARGTSVSVFAARDLDFTAADANK